MIISKELMYSPTCLKMKLALLQNHNAVCLELHYKRTFIRNIVCVIGDDCILNQLLDTLCT